MKDVTPTLGDIDHIHVFVTDRVKAEQWYEKVLGLFKDLHLAMWSADGGPLTLKNSTGTVHIALFERAAEKCRSTIAFKVNSEAFLAWRKHLVDALGYMPAFEDHDLSLSLYFSDPDGNPYEITTYEHETLRLALAKNPV